MIVRRSVVPAINPWDLLANINSAYDSSDRWDLKKLVPEFEYTHSLPIDVFETNEWHKIVLSVPGLNSESVNIEATEGVMTIKGEILPMSFAEDNVKHTVKSSVVKSEFGYKLVLPKNADLSGISADYTDGRLVITIGKIALVKPVPVTVSLNGQKAAREITENLETSTQN